MKPKLKKINFEKDNIRKYLKTNSSENVKICKPTAESTPLHLTPATLCSKSPNVTSNKNENTSRSSISASLKNQREGNFSKIDTVRSGGKKICNTFHSKMNFFQNLQSSAKSQGNAKILKHNPLNKLQIESETSEDKLTLFVTNPGQEYWTNGKPAAGCVDQWEVGRVRKGKSGDEM